MGTTPLGIEYPEPSSQPRRQALQDLAESADDAIIAAVGGAWTPYTSTATAGLTIGNGTIVAAVGRIGQFVRVRIVVTLGSTSSLTSNVALTLPAPPINADQALSCVLHDVSAGTSGRLAAAALIPASSATVQPWSSEGSLNSSVPFTWATGDKIIITGTYEAA